MKMSSTTVNCIICLKSHMPIKLEKENYSEGGSSNEWESIQSPLNEIFLLRKLLEIPQDVCSYLRQFYGDPCFWVSCCDSCSMLVNEGRRIFMEWPLLRKKFENVKNELKTSIVNSWQSNSNCDDDGIIGAAVTVRSYIKSANQKKIFIKDWDKILIVELTDFRLIPHKTHSKSVTSGSCFGVEESDEIDVKVFSSPLSCEEDEIEGNCDEESSSSNFAKPLRRSACRVKDSNEQMTKYKGIFNKVVHTGGKKADNDSGGKGFLQKNHENADKIIHTMGARRFVCNICGKRLENARNLTNHIHTHSGENPHKCRTCGKYFAKKRYLSRHQKIHTGGRSHRCETCGMNFTMPSRLQEHQRIHKENPHKCETCGKSFTEPHNLQTHQRIHTGERPYKCNICEKGFILSRDLKSHLATHTGVKPYECKICGDRFSYTTTRHRHMLEKHPGKKPYKCELCEKCFETPHHLKVHEKIHTFCDICGKGFPKPCLLKRHLRTHNTEMQFVCSTCGKAFSESINLKKHELAHIKKTTSKCGSGGNEYKQASALKGHLSSPPGERPTVSSIRKKPFYNSVCHKKDTLINVEEGDEIDVKIFSCPLSYEEEEIEDARDEENSSSNFARPLRRIACRVKAPNKQPSTLKGHLSSPLGERPSVSSIRKKTFSNSVGLKKRTPTHRKDNGEKSHKCGICGEMFPSFGLLVRHSFTHSKKKPLISARTKGEGHNHQQVTSDNKSDEEDQPEIYIIN